METPTKVGVIFDESSPNWSRIDMNNLMFLRMTMNYAQNMLQARGHVFVNEIFDMLGLKRRPFGQLLGWVHPQTDLVIYDVEKQDDHYILTFYTQGDIHESI